MNLLRNTMQSHDALITGKNVSQGFIEFDICERGKPRHIKSMHFRERCIQRSLCDNALVPILQRGLIYDNGASLEGKGIHFAINRLQAHLHRYYRANGFTNDGYIAVIDFSGYFDNILHEPVFAMLDKAFTDKRIVNLCRQFIAPFGEKSLGIGSQISQIVAVAYPNAIDHFIKQELRIKYYGRYMDDSYLIHHDKAYLQHCMERLLVEYEKLGIRVNR
ncbi:RNA-directed DNA polymerase, partial [Eubacteriales bacterium OttesenSCG-928-A19]|nr:RNA-directed DNA polymerase [Eubacteriales bacterium OttesenSCG-928-A19]